EYIVFFVIDYAILSHGYESIVKELQHLSIENRRIEVAGFSRILSVCETTVENLFVLRKNEEVYEYLSRQAAKVKYTRLISQEIHKVIDRYGLVKDDASEELAIIRRKLLHVKSQIGATFNRALGRYAQSGYLDEIRESV